MGRVQPGRASGIKYLPNQTHGSSESLKIAMQYPMGTTATSADASRVPAETVLYIETKSQQ